jgi:adenine-specific DNA-methyltransferase
MGSPGPGDPASTEPRLSWPDRGRPVRRDPETGRWILAATAEPARRPLPAGENLLVLGDAAAALGTLAATHRGKLRFITIDPPFNTGNELLPYDDRTAHSIWLCGMEERLRLARDLLCAGGFVAVHINVVEQAYLKVLLDELFGRDRLVAQISWQRAPDRTVLGQGSALVADHVEYILVYSNGKVAPDWPRPQRRAPLSEKTLRTYGRTLVASPESTLVDEITDAQGDPVKIYAHQSHRLEPAGKDLIAAYPRLMRTTNQQSESTFQHALLRRMKDPGVLYRAEYTQRRGKHRGARVRHYLNNNVVLWLRDIAVVENGQLIRVADLNNFWTADDIPATGMAGEGGVVLRRGKKPERLLERLISAFSLPGEWVMDFFAGSGTAGAVAHRLGRRFILVEAAAQTCDLAAGRLERGGAIFTRQTM